jgi:hypothetical protein
VAAAGAALAMACAYAGDPPGGPPDTTPPKVLAFAPESGAVLASPPSRVVIQFDEVISEQLAAGQRDIQGAVLLSPVTGKVSVDWHRTRLTVQPKGGFKPGRIYRVELLPGITDLRQNRMKQGKLAVFSTGPAIPDAVLRGTVVDWTGGRAAPAALVEAVLLPDSLPYRGLADSAGNFVMPMMPAGEYLVYGVVDQNLNRRREPREAFDTARVALPDSAAVELFAFTHDTLGPRLRTVEIADSLTLRLIFDRPLDPAQVLDTSMVQVAPAEDTTQLLALTGIFTPAGFDSLTRAAAARDSAQLPKVPAPARAAAAAPARAPVPPPPLPGRSAPRPDTTHAMRMLARHPSPTDRRLVRLAAALRPDARYQVVVRGVRGLTGVEGRRQPATLRVPRPAPTRATRADSLRRAGAPADTLHAPGAARPDSARARRDSTAVPPRPDSVPAQPDTTRPAPRPPPPARQR